MIAPHPNNRKCPNRTCKRILAPGSNRCHEHGGLQRHMGNGEKAVIPRAEAAAMIDEGMTFEAGAKKFGVAASSLCRAVKQYREQGCA